MAPTLPYRGCDEETMIYLLSITINLLVQSRTPRLSPVCVSVCVFLYMCLESELPGPVTHTSFLHACVLVCFSESKCVVCDSQTSDSMLGMRR